MIFETGGRTETKEPSPCLSPSLCLNPCYNIWHKELDRVKSESILNKVMHFLVHVTLLIMMWADGVMPLAYLNILVFE